MSFIMSNKGARWADEDGLFSPEDRIVSLKDDGWKTAGRDDMFEWWYTDIVFDDGSKLCINFFTKQTVFLKGPLNPMVTFNLDMADGTHIALSKPYSADEFSAALDRPDVKIGNNTFRGDLKHYDIHLELGEVTADIQLDSASEPWKPHTGALLMGDRGEQGDVPAIPLGKGSGTIQTAEGRQIAVNGTCYHDHQWGTYTIATDYYRWYWGRAKLDDYNVIAAYMYTGKEFDYRPFSTFLIEKDGKVVADCNKGSIKVIENGLKIDEETQKPYHEEIIYDWTMDDERYVVSFRMQNIFYRRNNLVMIPEEYREELIKSGFRSFYLRFSGTISIEHYKNGVLVDKASSNDGIWEEAHMRDDGDC